MYYEIEKLKINYKTLEEFRKFKEFGLQELSMLEDLEANIIENDSESPFYGIFFGEKLVARMSLYKVDSKFDHYFNPPQSYLEIYKLEVLTPFQRKGFGEALVNFAKSFQMPIKTRSRIKSKDFWNKMGFISDIEFETNQIDKSLFWFPTEEKKITG